MKKTVKINIGGVIFHLDEDAFEILQNYLAAINQRFASSDEGKEIIADIEHRIAEILQSKLTDQKQVISVEDINEVVEIMGRPEDFEGEEESNSKDSYQHDKTQKRLYRDPDNRVLGGVCSGIGNYLNIDPLIIRIIFILLMFAYGIIGIIYIVLWALLPAANTTAQKLDMRGERFNISDIEKNVRKEYENVKDNLKNIKNSKDYDRTRNFFESIIYAIGAFIRFIFKFIVGVFGLVLVVMGVGFLIGLTGTLIIGESFMPWNNIFVNDHVIFTDMIQTVAGPNTIWIFTICAILVVFIPLVAIIYGGLKLLLGLRPNDRPFAGIGFAVWLLSLIALVIITGVQVKNFSISVHNEEKIVIEEQDNKTLYLKTQKDNSFATSKFYIFDEEFQIMYDEDDDKQLLAFPEIDIIRGSSEQVTIEIKKKGRGSDRSEALRNADDIEYHVVQQDSIIIFDAVYSLVDKNHWRFPEVDITIRVPEGYILYLDESIEEQLDYIKFEDYYRHDEMVNKYWIMKEDGLEKYDKATFIDE
ncbi:MAG: PspC domain-containing protein [Bacteroidales bacterium]|jgi:phage shock protein PspC (stress-responsive transcriptional regulator)|nr:PspC domain-containing protein [Bacteroidales bacterium]